MSKLPDKQSPTLSPQAEADRQARLAREAAALRENLRRRKQQGRDRQAADSREMTVHLPPDAPLR